MGNRDSRVSRKKMKISEKFKGFVPFYEISDIINHLFLGGYYESRTEIGDCRHY
jgi:hypothetical protein